MSTHTITDPTVTAYSFGSLNEKCLSHMANNGIPFDGPIAVNERFHRFSIDQKKNQRDEWYIAWSGTTERGYEYLNCV